MCCTKKLGKLCIWMAADGTHAAWKKYRPNWDKLSKSVNMKEREDFLPSHQIEIDIFFKLD